MTPPLSTAESNPNPASSPFPSLRGGAPWPVRKTAARGSGSGRGWGPLMPGRCGGTGLHKEATEMPPPARSLGLCRGPPATPAPPRRRGGRSPFERSQRPLYMSLDTPFLEGPSPPASSSPLSFGEKVQAKFRSCCSVALPYSLLRPNVRGARETGVPSSPGPSAIRSNPWLSP